MINKSHQKYQLILWKDNPNDDLQCIKLLTVTYGTSCAPYLAIALMRCLKKLANDEEHTA